MADLIVYTTPADPRALPLIEELSREYDERYGLNDGVPSSFELQRYPAEHFSVRQGGAFLLVIRDGIAIAGSNLNVLANLNAFPRLPFNEGDLTLVGIITAVSALLVSLLGAVLGGLAGMRFHRKVDRAGYGA